jgi:UDP:flavonoid glycosyltransferase YjiC (YdhE family)
MRHILFMAEGATMAHFVRPLALARSLPSAEYKIFFYAPAEYAPHVGSSDFAMHPLNTMPRERFLANLSRGAPMYPPEVLRDYVAADREIIRYVRPDLVVGDLRLSLPISARLENVRLAMLMNAYWSPLANPEKILPEIPLTRVVPPRVLSPVYKVAAPLVSALHVGQMNKVRREFGLGPLPLEFGHMYMDGDYVLHPDVPEYAPIVDCPANHCFIGSCDWTPDAPKPSWWGRMRADPRPKILVALGSSGPVRVLPNVLSAFSGLNVAPIIATSGRFLPQDSQGYVSELLPLAETMAEASLVVCHGGSPLVYPALAAGVPVLGIPSNADQHLSTALLVKNGAGLGVRSEEASPRRLRAAAERLLSEAQFADAARRWKAIYARYDYRQLFRDFVRSAVGH